MELLSVLSWVLLGCLGLFLSVFLMGKVMYFDQQAQEAGRLSWLSITVNLFTSVSFSILVAREFESLFIKASILILGIGIGIALEIYRVWSFRKQNDKSTKDTQW